MMGIATFYDGLQGDEQNHKYFGKETIQVI
jgi:hypothetical protein